MNNKKTTKRALLSSVMAMLICVAMLIGTTFAWFTDSASTAVNKIQAGTLDVALEMKNAGGEWESAEGKTLSFKKAAGHENEEILWEPGCTYELPELRIVNKGNLALKYKIAVTGIQGSAKLNEAIDWAMSVDGTPAENLNSVVDKVIEPNNNSGSIAIKGHMKEEAGNEYQGLSIEGIAITVYATQYTSEYDSYNNTYDAGAEYGTAVATAAEFSSAIAAGKDVLLTSNIALDSQLNITNDISIYGNGHTVISNKPVNVDADANVTFKNVNFAAPTNANNKASNLYSSGLKGKLVLDGCTFSGAQWDCIQITPVAGAEIVISNCTFELNTPAQSGNKTRFIHIEAAYGSNSDVKITMTNNFFGASTYINEALIDIDYINLAGIDFGGNNIYTDTVADIYVCGASSARTITAAEAYTRLGSLKAADNATITAVTGNTAITSGSTATINNSTAISAGATISGDSKTSSVLKSDKSNITSDNVTIKNLTVEGSGASGTSGSMNISGNNTTIENVNYTGEAGKIAIAVSTGDNNSGTVIKDTKITNAFRGIQFWRLSGDSVIENCVLDISGYTFNIDSTASDATLTVKDSTLNGWTSYTSGIELVTFDNCKFGLNTYEYLRPYSNTVLKDCEFTSAGYQLNAGGSGAYTITLTNCTKNGTAITAENVGSLLLDTDGWNSNVTLIVNGVTVTVA